MYVCVTQEGLANHHVIYGKAILRHLRFLWFYNICFNFYQTITASYWTWIVDWCIIEYSLIKMHTIITRHYLFCYNIKTNDVSECSVSTVHQVSYYLAKTLISSTRMETQNSFTYFCIHWNLQHTESSIREFSGILWNVNRFLGYATKIMVWYFTV